MESDKFLAVLTDLEGAAWYILKIIRYLCKIDTSSGQCVSWKKCYGVMLVVLANKQSEETLKLLMNLEMKRKSSFIMD